MDLLHLQDATFPLPSATAGMIRAMQIEQHAGQYQDYQGRLNHEDYQQILSIQSQGPSRFVLILII